MKNLFFLILFILSLSMVIATPTPVPTEISCFYRDSSFNDDGIFIYSSPGWDNAAGIVKDNSGKYLIAGYRSGDMALWRLNSNGSLDLSFHSTGYITSNGVAGGNGDDSATGIVKDNTGNFLIISGKSQDAANNYAMVVWKYDLNGNPDTSFGNGNGYVTYTAAGGVLGDNIAEGLIITPNNKILVVGKSAAPGGIDKMTVWRLNPNGSLDTTFAGLGFAQYNSGTLGGMGIDITCDSSGNIYVVGFVMEPGLGSEARVWKILPNGSLDTSFNSTGFVTLSNIAGGNESDYGHYIYIDPYGKILITGQSTAINNSVKSDDMFIVRLNPNGSLDTSFNGTGIATHNNAAGGNGLDSGVFVTMNNTYGKIMVAGESESPYGPAMAVWRYNYDGSLDTSFNGTGYVSFYGAAGGNPPYDYATSVLSESEDIFIVTGISRDITGDEDMVVWRYVNLCIPPTPTPTTTPTPTPLPVTLNISKFHIQTDLKPGGFIDYMIKIINPSTYPVSNIAIWDTLPEKVKFLTHLEGVTPTVSSDNRFLFWDYTGYVLNPGESLSVKFRVEIITLKFSEYISNIAGTDYNDQYYTSQRHPPIFSRTSYVYNNKIVVFPNPVTTDGTLKFANLPVGSYVHIFTISGEFVTGLEAKTPVITWNTKNRFNCTCSPGVYYYIIYSKFMDEILQKGKLFIINQ